ncbi:MAG: hypothetical protein R2712_27270 [Vicinamibacterales bacterium]
MQADAGEPPFRFNVPSMLGASRVAVRQTLCDFGPWSELAAADLVPAGDGGDPVIEAPVVACATAVAVSGAVAGTRLRVISRAWQGPVGAATANGDRFVDVPLLFPTMPGDELHLETIACGTFQSRAERVFVLPAPERLGAPVRSREPLDDAGGTIEVRGVVLAPSWMSSG